MKNNNKTSQTKPRSTSPAGANKNSKADRTARPVGTAKKGVEPITKDRAILALILNVIVLPGLGTVIAGDTNVGVTQLVLFLVGIPLSFILIGIPLMIGMWIWALITGIQLVTRPS